MKGGFACGLLTPVLVVAWARQVGQPCTLPASAVAADVKLVSVKINGEAVPVEGYEVEAKGLTNSPQGRIAVGWLVVEDLAMVLVLVLLPPLAPVLLGTQTGLGVSVVMDIGLTLLKVALFLVLILVGGKKVIPWMLWHIAKTGSRELFTLSVIALAISFAYVASALFGVSFALGAFFAGMIMRESDLSHRAATESLPLRDAFAVLFFVSVGMLFDPAVLAQHPFAVACVFLIIVVGKSLAAAGLVLALSHSGVCTVYDQGGW